MAFESIKSARKSVRREVASWEARMKADFRGIYLGEATLEGRSVQVVITSKALLEPKAEYRMANAFNAFGFKVDRSMKTSERLYLYVCELLVNSIKDQTYSDKSSGIPLDKWLDFTSEEKPKWLQ